AVAEKPEAKATPVAKPAKAKPVKSAKAVKPVEAVAEEIPEAVETPAPKVSKPKVARKATVAKRRVAHRVTRHPKAIAHRATRRTAGSFTVQVGAFSQLSNAENLVSSLKGAGFPARLSSSGGASGGFTVHSTVVDNRAKSKQMLNAFNNAGHPSMLLAAGRGKYMLQLGKFSSRDRASALVSELNQKGLYASISSSARSAGTVSKVFVGKYSSLEAAQKAAAGLRAKNVPAVVVRH
ncbi:MAG: SPOR domain-containing protein, partial [Bacteroidota bacterium]